MRYPAAALLLLASLCVGADTKRKLPKYGQVEIAEVAARREPGRVALEGRVRNTGDKAIPKLQLLIDFRDANAKVVTTKRGPLDADLLEPGGEAEFRFDVADPVRAVDVQFQAEDEQKREVIVQKAGPHPIE